MQESYIKKYIMIIFALFYFITPLDALTKQEAEEKYLKYKKLAEQQDNITKKECDSIPPTENGIEDKANTVDQTTSNNSKEDKKTINNPWKGTSIGLGGSIVTGNSATTNLNAGVSINYKPIEKWQSSLLFNYLYSHDDNVSDTSGVRVNRAQLSANTSWNFDKINGVYGNLNFLRDELDVFRYVFMESLGYKRVLYKNDNMSLNITAGPSLTQNKLASTGCQFSSGIGAQSGLQYVWNFTEKTSFREEFIVNYSYQNNKVNPNVFIYQNNSILSTNIYKDLSLQLQFQLNGTNLHTAGKKPITTITTTALTYEI